MTSNKKEKLFSIFKFKILLTIILCLIFISPIQASSVIDYTGFFSTTGSVISHNYNTGAGSAYSTATDLGLSTYDIVAMGTPSSYFVEIADAGNFNGGGAFFINNPYGFTNCNYYIGATKIGSGTITYNYNYATSRPQFTFTFDTWDITGFTGTQAITMTYTASELNNIAFVAGMGVTTNNPSYPYLRFGRGSGTYQAIWSIYDVMNEQYSYTSYYQASHDTTSGLITILNLRNGSNYSKLSIKDSLGSYSLNEATVNNVNAQTIVGQTGLPLNLTAIDLHGTAYTKLLYPNGIPQASTNYSQSLDFSLNKTDVTIGSDVKLTATISGYASSGRITFYHNSFMSQTFTELYSTTSLSGLIQYNYTQTTGQAGDIDIMRAVLYDSAGNLLAYRDIRYTLQSPSVPSSLWSITPYDASHVTNEIYGYDINVTDITTGISVTGSDVSGSYTYFAQQGHTINIQISADGFVSANTNIQVPNFETQRDVSIFLIPIGYNEAGFHTASFTVLDFYSHNPISNVKLDILPINASIVTPVYTDINGQVTTKLIDNEQMFYYFSITGYNPVSNPENTTTDISRIIYMTPLVSPTVSPTITPIDTNIPITLVVQNGVTSTLLSGVTVSLYTDSNYQHFYQSDISDVNGILELTAQKSTTYYLKASKTGYLDTKSSIKTGTSAYYNTIKLYPSTGNTTITETPTSTNPIVNLFIPLANVFGIFDLFTISMTVGLMIIVILAIVFFGAIASIGGGAMACGMGIIGGSFIGFVFNVASGIWPLWTIILLILVMIIGGYITFKSGNSSGG